jgi:type I restriction enzyme, R subunit
MASPNLTPEQKARQDIDAALERAGWVVQSHEDIDLDEARGVAVREVQMKPGHGFADYLLFVDGRPVGALEAKRSGVSLSGVVPQASKYAAGLPTWLDAPIQPLPFLYVSTGVETKFSNLLDPHPRSRTVTAPHRPETLAEWLAADPLSENARPGAVTRAADATPGKPGKPRPSTLRGRLRNLPPLPVADGQALGLWPNQRQAIANLEQSLAEDRPRALIQMATGSGKSLTAVASIYRLIKHGGARRVLFLVDRQNLAEQAENEFAGYRTYDDHRKLTELYTVQRMAGNQVRDASKIVICTIQRLYSMLRGEPELDAEAELHGAERGVHGELLTQPIEVEYSAAIPPEFFDVVYIDECHRSIYTLWRQVIEYFDAFLIGLTATPAKQTYGFFNKNLVMEYDHARAVADAVNVDFDIYRIRTRITEQGALIEAAPGVTVGRRARQTRALRWEQPDEDISYTAKQLDRDVVARDQIRTVVRAFRDRLFSEIFPGRTHVPKTVIFAKDDSHAEDIVEIVREEFGRGDEFCQKITYKVTGVEPKTLIQEFRTGFHPRIAVTVDMISTGTDVRPIEIVMFMRSVKSHVLYEQMKGRGVRVVSPDELRAVTPDAEAKTHYVIVDCVGVTETEMQDTQPLERQRGVSFEKLIEQVSLGRIDADAISSLAGRLSRLDRRLSPEDRQGIEKVAGAPLHAIIHGLVESLDADAQVEAARAQFGLGAEGAPTDEQIDEAARKLMAQAVKPLKPKVRKLLIELKQQADQIIDEVSRDQLLSAGPADSSRDRARDLVQSFQEFLAQHRDEIDALQFFYSQPYKRRLRFDDIKKLAETIQAPPRQWTPERLWQAYEQLEGSRVRGASGRRLLTDMVSLVRFALQQDAELVPYADQVRTRFTSWMAQQQNTGRRFTDDQMRWLEMMRDHVAQSIEIDMDDFDYTPFVEQGGRGRAAQVFGTELPGLLHELNEALAA